MKKEKISILELIVLIFALPTFFIVGILLVIDSVDKTFYVKKRSRRIKNYKKKPPK